jgi:hypothetical protein
LRLEDLTKTQKNKEYYTIEPKSKVSDVKAKLEIKQPSTPTNKNSSPLRQIFKQLKTSQAKTPLNQGKLPPVSFLDRGSPKQRSRQFVTELKRELGIQEDKFTTVAPIMINKQDNSP